MMMRTVLSRRRWFADMTHSRSGIAIAYEMRRSISRPSIRLVRAKVFAIQWTPADAPLKVCITANQPNGV